MACFPFLFQDIIYKVKTVFNGEFNAAFKQKEFEIIRVKERNVRLREIILDLELEETIWQPEFEDCEKPERTLVVEDHEVLASMSPFPSLSDFPSYCLLVLFILQEVY
jgi:hypothetical protein